LALEEPEEVELELVSLFESLLMWIFLWKHPLAMALAAALALSSRSNAPKHIIHIICLQIYFAYPCWA